MASITIMIGGAVLNAAAITGGNYLAKYIAGDSGQAALAEKNAVWQRAGSLSIDDGKIHPQAHAASWLD